MLRPLTGAGGGGVSYQKARPRYHSREATRPPPFGQVSFFPSRYGFQHLHIFCFEALPLLFLPIIVKIF